MSTSESTVPPDRGIGPADGGDPPTPTLGWGALAGTVLGLAALLSLVLVAFSWPTVNQEPRGVPIAVVGPPEAVGALAEQAGEEAFDVTVAADRDAAQRLVEDREAYGAVVLGPEGGEVLVASAASPAVAQLLTRIGGGAPEQIGGPFPVTDLAPLPEDDPMGGGLPSAILPLVIGGVATAVLMTARTRGVAKPLAGALAVAAVAGPALTCVLQGWLGALEGDFWTNSAVMALGMAAISTALLGLHRVFGRLGSGTAGLALGAATMVLLGNPLSGLMSAPEMLPVGWGQLGQWLPPGATGTALRGVAWFDGAGTAGAFTVLAVWLAAGVALSLIPARAIRTGAARTHG